MNNMELDAMLQKGIILLDGATGSELRRRGMPVGIATELWAWEHPDIVTELQREYVDAGSDIIYAPTFSANRLSLRARGIEDRIEALNADLVVLSRRAAGDRALVAGDLAPTGQSLEPIGTLTYEALFDVYREQIELLNKAGVDLIVAETMMSIDETVCAVEAARDVCDLPVLCTLTMEADGHLMFGGTAAEAVETLQAVGASAVGLNCSVGPDQLEAVVRGMKAVAEVPVIAKPNAGIPVIDAQGLAHYSMGPEAFVKAMRALVEAGAQIVGGCCGTNPEYIRLLNAALR